MQTLQQFEEEANAVPAGNEAFNPFEAPAYAAGGGRGKGKGVTGVCVGGGGCWGAGQASGCDDARTRGGGAGQGPV
jgi:hypothetical protein